jgi:hypothetical protein
MKQTLSLSRAGHFTAMIRSSSRADAADVESILCAKAGLSAGCSSDPSA